MKDYLSVKEFSRISSIETSTLRYWDEIGLFSPAWRDPETNYRYYSPEQIIGVNFINVMSALHVPLKTIGDIESDRNPEKIVRLIEQQEKALDMQMRRLRECYSVIHTRREMINYGMKVLEGFRAVDGIRLDSDSADEIENAVWVDLNRIAVLRREDSAYIAGPRTRFKKGGGFFEPFMNFCNYAEELRINLNFPIGGLHDDMESFCQTPGEPHHFISMDPTGNRNREAGDYLIGFHRGYYGEFGNLPARMAAYVKRHKLNCSGPVYSLYLHDEVCIKKPDQYLAQVCVAVSR
ncbi:MAG: MerR family transcriptional regulator [Oscillospiraceae bacterium]|nr:MerR family transcriptional regulator [Oscillospiraceae bacterium]